MKTRRDFLKTGALAGAFACNAPFILRSSAQTGPDPVRLGFIGLGRMGRSHMNKNFLKLPDALGVAVCDVSALRRDGRRDELAQLNKERNRGGEVRAFSDHRDLLAWDGVDAVVIATPDHWHAPITLDALAAEKDVYCEKPLTHTVHEAFALMDAVKRHGRILQTGSQQRTWWPEFRVACELVINGVIGEITEVNASFGGPPKACDLPGEELPEGIDFDRWLGPAPARPYHSKLCPNVMETGGSGWRPYREYGNGAVGDFGAHNLDIARWGMELDDELPVKIELPKPGATGGGKLVFANGTVINHASGQYGVSFVGETGKINVGRDRFELWRGDGEKDHEFISRHQVKKAEEKYLGGDAKRLYNSNSHHQDFLDAVRSRERPICHEDVGGRTAACCCLLSVAYRYGRSLEFDPANRTFAPGGGDPAWLGKEYRTGYELPKG